jgi:hypothetical protein
MFLMLALGPHRSSDSPWLLMRGRAAAFTTGVAVLVVVGTFWASSGSQLFEYTHDLNRDHAAFEYISPDTNEPAPFRLKDIDPATVPASVGAETALWKPVHTLPTMLDQSASARSLPTAHLPLMGVLLMLGVCLMLWPYRILVRKGRLELATKVAATLAVASTVWVAVGHDPLLRVAAGGYTVDAGFLLVALLIAWFIKPTSWRAWSLGRDGRATGN